MTVYGVTLAAARRWRGWTQKDVAREFEARFPGQALDGQQVSKWERGVTIPEARRAVDVLMMLGVPEDEAIMAWARSLLDRPGAG